MQRSQFANYERELELALKGLSLAGFGFAGTGSSGVLGFGIIRDMRNLEVSPQLKIS